PDPDNAGTSQHGSQNERKNHVSYLGSKLQQENRSAGLFQPPIFPQPQDRGDQHQPGRGGKRPAASDPANRGGPGTPEGGLPALRHERQWPYPAQRQDG